jgi:hypothetical protein
MKLKYLGTCVGILIAALILGYAFDYALDIEFAEQQHEQVLKQHEASNK